MLMAPAARSASRTQTEQLTQPAPIRGMNARDPLSAMKTGDAIRIDNMICRPFGLELRAGKERYYSGLDGDVVALAVYGKKSTTLQLIASTATSVYAIPAEMASPIEELGTYLLDDDGAYLLNDDDAYLLDDDGLVPGITGLSGGRWVWAPIVHHGGSIVVGVNGSDGVRAYNGTGWSTPVLTSALATATLDATLLFQAATHMRRVFFAERGALRLWYLGLDAIGGPAWPLDLAPLCRSGGEIVAIASMTTDGGRNSNDRLLAVTSQGEMVVFGGVSPSKADTWQALGVWDVALPVGDRCFLAHGGDTLYLSRDGVLPVSDVLAKPDPEKPPSAITEPIRNLYLHGARTAPYDDEWCMVSSTHHRLMLINMPTPSGPVQLVKSGDIGCGWSDWINLPALCWADTGTDLFFGAAGGEVWRYRGETDDGEAITGLLVEAYTKHRTPARKSYSRVRPIFDRPAAMRSRVELRTNLRPIASCITGSLTTSATTWSPDGWSWSMVDWPLTPLPWSPSFERGATDVWRGINGHGQTSAFMMAVTSVDPVVYEGHEIIFQSGGGV